MKIKNYTTMKISETFCSLKTTATVILLGALLLANTTVNAQNNALHFDGINDYVQMPASINDQITTNNVTIEGWFYIEAIDEGVTLVGETYAGGSDTVKFELYYLGGNIVADFNNIDNTFPNVAFSPPAFNTWVHIAATYNGANLRLFYNGVQVASASSSAALPTSVTGLWLMGKTPDAAGEFTGKMDEIRIWNVARTEPEILANYKLQVAPSTPGLVAYYKMDQGVGGGNNAGITSLTNSSSVPSLDGTLLGPFALTGSTSNFVETGIPTVYNGGWSQGAPNATRDAVIEGNYSVAANIAAKTLTVNNSAVVTIPSGNNVTVTDAVTVTAPATFTLSNNANLIQVNNGANSGAITVNRNSSSLLRLDYTLWSSPVSSQNLAAFSPLTSQSPSRFYTFDTGFGTNGQYNEITSPTTTSFVAGAGYLIRMPNDASAGTPTAYPGVFTGIPNNGDVPVTLIDGGLAGLRYNLVGNPYPSPIKMSNFVFDNTANIQSTLYFWRKTNNLGTAYCTWVAGPLVTDPGTFVENGNLQTFDPLGVIQTGQGFFVEAKSGASSLTFKNTQRLANNAGQFFKTNRVTSSGKIWINATNLAGNFSQMAITYFPEATLGIDPFDGKYFNDSKMALSSNINNEEYTIQGRPAFNVSDEVALIFKTDEAGNYTIAIDHVNGLFSNGQDIYLIDSKTGTETNLKTGAYNFTAEAGVDYTRFSLKYQKTLKVDDAIFNENTVTVYAKNGSLYVNAGEIAINNIQVYDVQGRLLAERRNVKSSTATLDNLKANNQVLLVKISGVNNEEVTKKVLN
jgi:hypothetical protein